jgi:NAD(P)-dependent dehydrogenase (short-subunit alcohol dehydrogenase family)
VLHYLLRGGIGYATAVALAKLGCSIAVHYNSAEAKAKQLVQELQAHPDVKAASFQADLSNYDNVRKLHADVVKTLGDPDILFNNAGVLGGVIGPHGNIQDVSVETFEATWRANTGSAYLVSFDPNRYSKQRRDELTFGSVDAVMHVQHGTKALGSDSVQFKVSM